MLTQYEQHGRRKLAAIVITVGIVGGTVIVTDQLKTKGETNTATELPLSSASTASGSSPTTTTTPAPTSTSASTSSSASAESLKDGAYSATTTYYVPHGMESIKVNLTLSGGVITSATIQNSEGDHESAAYQEDFAAAYKSYVVGKSISGLQLDVVSGASDTTQGFNEAVSKIAAEAKA